MTFQSPFLPRTLWGNDDPNRVEVIQVKGKNKVFTLPLMTLIKL